MPPMSVSRGSIDAKERRRAALGKGIQDATRFIAGSIEGAAKDRADVAAADKVAQAKIDVKEAEANSPKTRLNDQLNKRKIQQEIARDFGYTDEDGIFSMKILGDKAATGLDARAVKTLKSMNSTISTIESLMPESITLEQEALLEAERGKNAVRMADAAYKQMDQMWIMANKTLSGDKLKETIPKMEEAYRQVPLNKDTIGRIPVLSSQEINARMLGSARAQRTSTSHLSRVSKQNFDDQKKQKTNVGLLDGKIQDDSIVSDLLIRNLGGKGNLRASGAGSLNPPASIGEFGQDEVASSSFHPLADSLESAVGKIFRKVNNQDLLSPRRSNSELTSPAFDRNAPESELMKQAKFLSDTGNQAGARDILKAIKKRRASGTGL